MTAIKICGIIEVEHALAAAEAGADFVGLVFATSKRQVTAVRARQIALALEHVQSRPKTVGIFVNSSSLEVNQTVDWCHLDWVQLSGDEPWDFCRSIERPVIKAVRVQGPDRSIDIMASIVLGHKIIGMKEFIPLLDSHVEGLFGGTGHVFDWDVAQEVAKWYPIVLAGGLSPENVAQAIQVVHPWGVDVSSGVETEGMKDIEKIRRFCLAAREADEMRPQR